MLARPRGRGRRRLPGRHAAGAARCAFDGCSPSSCNDRSGGFHRNGEIYPHWLVTARVNFHLGIFGLGDGFRSFKADPTTSSLSPNVYKCQKRVSQMLHVASFRLLGLGTAPQQRWAPQIEERKPGSS